MRDFLERMVQWFRMADALGNGSRNGTRRNVEYIYIIYDYVFFLWVYHIHVLHILYILRFLNISQSFVHMVYHVCATKSKHPTQ